jgi:fibronectin type 3 domain-containing protein
MNPNTHIRRTLLLALAAAASATIAIGGVAQASPRAASEAPPTTTPAAGDDVAPTTAAAVTTTSVAPTTTLPPSSTSTTIAPTTTMAPSTTQAPTTTDPQETMFVVSAAVAPTKPQSVTAKPQNSSVKLTWIAPADNGGATIDKYAVQRALSAGGPFTTIATPNALSYTAMGLTNGTTYYFRILAHNSAGWSAPSSVVNAVPRTVPTNPLSPLAVPLNQRVDLTWAAPASNGGAAIDKYRVERATSSAGPWTVLAKPNALSYSATGLTNGTRYYFRITAHNAAGWGTPSVVVNAKPSTVPSRPELPYATAADSIINLTWVAGNNGGAAIDTYAVQRATSYNGVWSTIGYPTATAYSDGNLVIGTTYYYRILAHNASGWSVPSVVTAMKAMSAPSAPRLCTVFQTYEGSHLAWFKFVEPLSDGGSPIDHYVIQVYDNVGEYGNMDAHVEIEAGESSVYEGALATLDFGQDYTARIWAFNSIGVSQYCEMTFDMHS